MNKSIEEIIKTIASTSNMRREEPVWIRWEYGSVCPHAPDEHTPEIAVLNNAFNVLPLDDGVALAKDVLSLYVSTIWDVRYSRISPDDLQRARAVFGYALDPELTCRIHGTMSTLTGSGKQFRVWYAPPGHISRDHVDSCGSGIILSIEGDDRKITRIAAKWKEGSQPLVHPCGTKLYL